MRALSVCFAAWAVTTVLAVAQARPDFSGRWVLESPPETPAPVAHELKVKQATDSLRIDYPSEISGSYTVEYMLGIAGMGSVSGGIVGGGGARTATRSSARWLDDTLFLERSVSVTGGPQRNRVDERSERWSIDSRGRLIIDVTDRHTGEPTTTKKLTYVKK